MSSSGFSHQDLPSEINALAREVVEAFGVVRKELGVGLLEGVYVEALCVELASRGLSFARNPRLPIVDKGVAMSKGCFPDLIVEDSIVVEAKAVEAFHPARFAKLLIRRRAMKRPVP
jgi:GxxExxY protein